MLAKIRNRAKKIHGYNFAFQVLPLNQPLNIPIGPTLIQYGSLKRKIVAVSFFRTVSLDNFFSLKFDPTSTSHNLVSKNYSNKNYHIFRKPWTSAFRWYTLDTSEKCSNLRKKSLRLRSFGPFWTISTENQWEITEIERLSCFGDFFCKISHCL